MTRRRAVNFKGDWRDWEAAEAEAILRQRLKLFGRGEPVPLILLGREMCRFPVAENAKAVGVHLFCGRPTAGDDVYCREHLAVTITAPRGR